MAEVIVTFDSGGIRETPVIRTSSYVYDGDLLSEGRLYVLAGTSPVREALVARSALSDQDLDRWREMPVGRIAGVVIGESGTLPQDGLANADVVRDRLLDHIDRVLRDASGSSVERHVTPFGLIFAVVATHARLLGIAVDGTWPCIVLELDWIDRERGTIERIDIDPSINLLQPADVVALYRRACELPRSEAGGPHVDSTTT
jgi:hypothetical protein